MCGKKLALAQINDFLNVHPKGITNSLVKIKEALSEISLTEINLTKE
jgi:hypothetical protein